MTAPRIKGWCPGAHRPMMSGDGLIVRVRPKLGRLTATQVLGLCDVAQDHGNGIIDLTSRANLQIRGIQEDAHPSVLTRLAGLGLLDEDPDIEARRNILTTPLWNDGDLTTRLHATLCARLRDLPELPAKMGFALDTGTAPILGACSADFRFERGSETPLILRLDGMTSGRNVSEENAIDALVEMAEWFVATGGATAGRMARHVIDEPPPRDWSAQPAAQGIRPLQPGPLAGGYAYGVAFGAMDAGDLAALVQGSHARALRCTPWRVFALEAAHHSDALGFITSPGDPVLGAHACPGAPACASATVDTRKLALSMAPLVHGDLHVSGCTKGCAYRQKAAVTLVGRDGAYDLVENGHSWDQPHKRGLTAHDVMSLLD